MLNGSKSSMQWIDITMRNRILEHIESRDSKSAKDKFWDDLQRPLTGTCDNCMWMNDGVCERFARLSPTWNCINYDYKFWVWDEKT